MSAVERAIGAWGDLMPDWVRALAAACDRQSQNAVATRLGYSAAVVSTVLTRKYAGSLAKVELAVRGALMSLRVECPVMGEIPTNDCISNQRADFSAASRMSVRLHATCPNCRHSRQGGKNA